MNNHEHNHEGCCKHDNSARKRCSCGEIHSNEPAKSACCDGHAAKTSDDDSGGDDPDSDHHNHDGHSHTTTSKKDVILLCIATLLFAIALLIPSGGIALAVFIASALFAGTALFIDGIKKLIRFKFDENVLLLIAVLASFILGEYPEACLVTILLKLGGFIESIAISRSQKNMEALTKIRPDTATVMDQDGNFVQIDARKIAINDTFYLRAGDRVAVDCVVADGHSTVDKSALTGEAIPESVTVGDTLLSSSINLDGVLKCTATNTFENSTATQIIELVYASSKLKGKTESFITRVAAVYTPIVVVLAVLIAVIPPLLGLGTYHDFIMRALIFLVASCPCALVISIPLTFFSGIGAVSKQGVLVKGSMFIEKLAKITAVAFDKTGTLTSGKLEVDKVVILDGDKNELLSILHGAEKTSTHPIAAAIVAYCNNIPPSPLSNISEQAGLGLTATFNGDQILCGGKNMLLKSAIDATNFPDASVYLCVNSRLVAYVTIKEEISKPSLTIVSNLSDVGVNRVVMLTGDSGANAAKVAAQCGITEVYSSLLPVDKVAKVELIKQSGQTVLFVGDGINDAPVLTVADLGASMGFGSEIANISSDIILSSNSTSSVPKAIKTAKRTMAVVYVNIIFALSIKAIVLILGALGLATMWFAVFADIGVTILTVLNSIRLLKSNRSQN